MVALLGVLLGSQFTADIFDRVADWYVGITGVVVSVIVMVGLAYLVLRKLGGYDPPTAYFSAMPGGLSEMMVLGESMGGDGRKISLTHGARILIAVFLIAFYYRIFEGYTPVGLPVASDGPLAWHDIVLLVACALIGYPAARMLRVPAAQLVGPLVLSAALHMTGVVSAQPPGELIAAAQVVLGAAIGARFAGMGLAEVWRVLLLAAVVALIMVVVAAGAAFGLAEVAALSGPALFLALAPGGLAEMSLIALSFGSAAAFVSTHHIVRIILIVILAPMLFRMVRARGR
jgi:membrane AbrB-like protein